MATQLPDIFEEDGVTKCASNGIHGQVIPGGHIHGGWRTLVTIGAAGYLFVDAHHQSHTEAVKHLRRAVHVLSDVISAARDVGGE